ncbi:hypothetical protein T484DRAFT_1868260 [Baffinella frigidus]|nr:hypothetical protein T484DRAFT_1868260 [Cryptophyta sp. CCMP2293]
MGGGGGGGGANLELKPAGDQLTPLEMFPLMLAAGRPGVKAVSCGDNHALATLVADSALWAWGCNARGQLGLGDRISRFVPTRIPLDASILPGVPPEAGRISSFSAGTGGPHLLLLCRHRCRLLMF